MIRGHEFHSILKNIFDDVNGYLQSEQLQVNCPRCQEREGLSQPDGKFNLEINTSKRMFRCWKCDEPQFSGSLGKLIRIYGNRSDYEIYKSYVNSYGAYDVDENEDEIDEFIPVSLPKEMISFSKMDVNDPNHFEAYNYLINERKISREIILKYRLGFCLEGRYKNRIIIPSYDEIGNINYFVSRTYDPTIKKMKYDNPKLNKNKIIFNEGYIKWDSTIFLVEGVFEMLSFPINTIPMLGKEISHKLLMKLKELKPEIVVLLDPDAFSKSVELFQLLSNVYLGYEDKIRLVKLPDKLDLDEIKRFHGPKKVVEYLMTARKLTIDDFFVKNLNNEYDRGERKRFNKQCYFGC